MEHPNARRFRDAFEALWERGDTELASAMLHEHVDWTNDIGAGPFHHCVGRDAVMAMQADWMELFQGDFQQHLVDVCSTDANLVAILHETGDCRGNAFDNLALYHYEFDRDGRVARVHTYDRDRDAVERFWASVGPVRPSDAYAAEHVAP